MGKQFPPMHDEERLQKLTELAWQTCESHFRRVEGAKAMNRNQLYGHLQAGSDLRIPIMDALHTAGIAPDLATMFGLLWVAMYLNDGLRVAPDDETFMRLVEGLLQTHRNAVQQGG